MDELTEALVVGAGPAGLMAAGALADAGLKVVVTEAQATPARKFLMAGKSGLNITKDETPDTFLSRYDVPRHLGPMVAGFGPDQVRAFCRDLGQEVFTGSSGRVFPVAMKGSPLLRAWLARLAAQGVNLRARWRWTGWTGGKALAFDTPAGRQSLSPRVTVLALGGASWPRLGSDAAWVPWLTARGVPVAPFRPANMGFGADWSPQMARHFGQAVKGAALMAGGRRERGEFVLSARGLEGGGIYALSAPIRDGAALSIDLMPDTPEDGVRHRLARMKPGDSLSNRLRKLGLSPAAAALVMEWGRGMDPALAVKALPARLTGPRPLTEAISSAGGVMWQGLSPGLELRACPGVFCAGEMLDWEAPTGGYLLTACWATGLWAGQAAARQARGGR